MKNFLFHIFVFLPLAGAAFGCAYGFFIYLNYVKSMWNVPPINFGGRLMYIFILALILGCSVISWLIDCKIRCIENGVLKFFNLFLTPIRLPLQILGGLFAFIAIFSDSIESYRKVETEEGFFAGLTSMLFNFYFDTGYSARHPKREDSNYKFSIVEKTERSDSSGHLEYAVSMAIADIEYKSFYGEWVDVSSIDLKCDVSECTCSIKIYGTVYFKKRYSFDPDDFDDYGYSIKEAIKKIENALEDKLENEIYELQEKYINYDHSYDIRFSIKPIFRP